MRKLLSLWVCFAYTVCGRRLQGPMQQAQILPNFERRYSQEVPNRAPASRMLSLENLSMGGAFSNEAYSALAPLAMSLLAFQVATSFRSPPLHALHPRGHRDVAMNVNREPGQAANPEDSKSAPEIFTDGVRNVVQDGKGWLFGKPSNLYSNLESEQELQRMQLMRVVESLESDMPRILREDPSWDIFSEDVSIIIGETGNRVQGIGPCILFLNQLRKQCAQFGDQGDVPVRFLLEDWKSQSTALPEFLKGNLKVSIGRAKLPHWETEIPLDFDFSLSFHVNDKQSVDYVRIENVVANGRLVQMWPEAAVSSLREDMPNLLAQELNWEYFAKDFIARDRTGITGDWDIPTLETNQAILALVRQSRSALAVLLKDDLQVDISRSFVVTADDALKPALFAKWRFSVRGEVDLPLLGKSAFGIPLDVAGTSIFLFDPDGKINSMEITPLTVNGNELRLPKLEVPDFFGGV